MTVAHSKSLEPVALNLSHIRFTDEQFLQLCLHNPERSLELTAEGELILVPPYFVCDEEMRGRLPLREEAIRKLRNQSSW
jgi:hypothetical protein